MKNAELALRLLRCARNDLALQNLRRDKGEIDDLSRRIVELVVVTGIYLRLIIGVMGGWGRCGLLVRRD